MVTGATYHKEHFFKTESSLDFLQTLLFDLAKKYGWLLEAWAIFSNHYHFLAQSPIDPSNLRKFITHFHASSARYLNKQQDSEGRKVWHQYWDSQVTYQGSYIARLKYVMDNPVRHGLVANSHDYKWCSASWFNENASEAYVKTISRVQTDCVNIEDDY